MRLLVTGDRNWVDIVPIQTILSLLPRGSIIIHGDAAGADKLAGAVAFDLKLTVDIYPANWELYGRAAGPLRNVEMLRSGRPDFVVGFHNNLEASRGTRHMLDIASKANKPIIHYGNNTWLHLHHGKVSPIKETDLKKVMGLS